MQMSNEFDFQINPDEEKIFWGEALCRNWQILSFYWILPSFLDRWPLNTCTLLKCWMSLIKKINMGKSFVGGLLMWVHGYVSLLIKVSHVD